MDYAAEKSFILICGHYEGVDQRALDALVDEEVSIGDYVLTGGELAACVFIDAVARQLPGVLGDENSAKNDSFFNGLLDYPHYTRPASLPQGEVPQVLLGGNHEAIASWRREQALLATLQRRPDLLETAPLTAKDREFLKQHKRGQ
jgi:tRNA (guanine37-N1)-methyltransferase